MSKSIQNPSGVAAATFDRLRVIETDEHVLWPHLVHHSGYGIYRRDGRLQRVHRVALALRTTEQPASVVTCHDPQFRCPKTCMNYRHLYWGSRYDNAQDGIVEGAVRRGSRHGMAVLIEDQVREIRAKFAELPGSTLSRCRTLGEQYGVSMYTVKAIVVGDNWAWLD